MTKAITQLELNKLAKMIREWPENFAFNWNNICLSSKNIIGYIPTRQALSGKPILKNSYIVKKTQLKLVLNKFQDVPRPQSMLDAVKKISRLQSENKALEEELSKMAELANRFIYNASINGLSQAQLTAPLPKKYNN